MMRVLLTPSQAMQLRPYFERIRAEAQLGTPGMLVGQISYDETGQCWIVPAFLSHELAELITTKGRQL